MKKLIFILIIAILMFTVCSSTQYNITGNALFYRQYGLTGELSGISITPAGSLDEFSDFYITTLMLHLENSSDQRITINWNNSALVLPDDSVSAFMLDEEMFLFCGENPHQNMILLPDTKLTISIIPCPLPERLFNINQFCNDEITCPYRLNLEVIIDDDTVSNIEFSAFCDRI